MPSQSYTQAVRRFHNQLRQRGYGQNARPSSSSNIPRTPSLADTVTQHQNTINTARQNILSQLSNMREIPTFSASYYMPQNMLRQIQQTINTSPDIDEEQLRQRAETQTYLLTNPQIEALRNQINAFKSLIPQVREEMLSSYNTSLGQLQQGAQDVLAEAYQEGEAQGGLRPGAVEALRRQMQATVRPMYSELRSGYLSNRDQVLNSLESQKQHAQNLLNTIESNKDNMTRENYNALRDQAIQQFRTAQEQQVRILNELAGIEAGARQTSAQLQQEAAKAYNEFLRQLVEQQLGQLSDMEAQFEQQRQSLTQSNMAQWQDFLTRSTNVRDRGDALRLLRQYRYDIEKSVGPEGYQQLEDYIYNTLGPDWTNPRYISPTPTTTTYYPSVGLTRIYETLSPDFARQQRMNFLNQALSSPNTSNIRNSTTQNDRSGILNYLLMSRTEPVILRNILGR